MDRRRFAVALIAGLLAGIPAAAHSSRYDRGLLWRVERRSVAPSWLFGTLHRRDSRLLPLPAPVAAAFRRCRRLIIELFPDEGVSRRFSEAARLDGEAELPRFLRADAWAAIYERLAAAGVPGSVAARLKPWAALLLVTSAEPRDDVNSLDNELVILARYANMRVEELESVEEQVAVFDDIPLASQVALLEAAVDFHELLHRISDESVNAYLDRDLRRLQALGRVLEQRRPELAVHQRTLEKKIVQDRSVVMAYRMQPHLRRGRSFVAVGASHLQGELGIPRLLSDEYGWRVRPAW